MKKMKSWRVFEVQRENDEYNREGEQGFGVCVNLRGRTRVSQS